jgi:hypothetical protein
LALTLFRPLLPWTQRKESKGMCKRGRGGRSGMWFVWWMGCDANKERGVAESWAGEEQVEGVCEGEGMRTRDERKCVGRRRNWDCSASRGGKRKSPQEACEKQTPFSANQQACSHSRDATWAWIGRKVGEVWREKLGPLSLSPNWEQLH